MTWVSQVWRVYRKDLRATWMLQVLLLGALSVTCINAVRAQDATRNTYGWTDTFVPLTVFAIMMNVARLDAPGRSSAFWASQPFAPSAMATAKLLQTVQAAIAMLLGVFFVMFEWGIRTSDIAAMMITAAIPAVSFGLTALHLATLAPESRGAVVLLGASTVAVLAIVFRTLPPAIMLIDSATFKVLWLTVTMAGAATVVQCYRVREPMLALRGMTGLLAVATIFCAIRSAEPEFVADADSVNTSAVAISIPQDRISNPNFLLKIDATIATSARSLRLVDAQATLEYRDGSHQVVGVSDYLTTEVSSGIDPLVFAAAGGIDSTDDTPRTVTAKAVLTTSPLATKDLQRALEGVVRVVLSGTVQEYDLRLDGRHPLRSGLLRDHGNKRTQLEVPPPDTSGIVAVLTSRTLEFANANSLRYTNQTLNQLTEYALVDRTSGRSIALRRGNTSQVSPATILPGLNFYDHWTDLRLWPTPGSGLSSSDLEGWRDNGDLVILAPVLRRAFKIRAETVVGRR